MRLRLAIFLPLAWYLTGCSTLAPVYQRPTLPIKDKWPNLAESMFDKLQGTRSSADAAERGWQNFFIDPQLQALIDTALKHNRDLRVATYNIEKARAEYQVQRADLWPAVGVTSNVTRQRTLNMMNPTGANVISTQYKAGIGFSDYEIDFFGRLQSLKERSWQLYLATEAAQRTVAITVIAQVVGAYLNLLADNECLRLAQESLVSQEATYRLTAQRFKAGLISQQVLNNAKIALDNSQSSVALYLSRMAANQQALQLLLGTPIASIAQQTLDRVEILTQIPANLPSDLLQQRPDIIAAEHQLKAAYANIGAMRAAFFPQIKLTANIGTMSTALSQLFHAGTGAWTFIPQLALPLFAGGKHRANLDIATIIKDINIANYEKTIQVAFKEASDALSQYHHLGTQLRAQQRVTERIQKNYTLSMASYTQGISNYVSVLAAQLNLYQSKQNLVQARLAHLTALITLYKALGGGQLIPSESTKSTLDHQGPTISSAQ